MQGQIYLMCSMYTCIGRLIWSAANRDYFLQSAASAHNKAFTSLLFCSIPDRDLNQVTSCHLYCCDVLMWYCVQSTVHCLAPPDTSCYTKLIGQGADETAHYRLSLPMFESQFTRRPDTFHMSFVCSAVISLGCAAICLSFHVDVVY